MFLIIATSHESFAIDTWGAVICSLGTWSQGHAYDPSDIYIYGDQA